jgi:ubiquinone/menaquinone biosynthesis C-methylase UbiE
MTPTRVIDYEGSKYSAEFWTPAREYEDRVERIALKAMLPPGGGRLIDIGAGAGRLGGLYLGYAEVVLMDYARSTVLEARQRWGHDPRFKFVAADVYRLPFANAAFDTVVMVRVIHHLADVPKALNPIATTLRSDGAFLLEFANKRNLKSMLRYALRRQAWSPYTREPIEFVELNFDFHPAWMKARMREAGFEIQQQRSVSFFRTGALKRLFGAKALASIDGALQRPLAPLAVSPSLFLKCAARHKVGAGRPAGLFKCPACGSTELAESADELTCANGHRWPMRDGVYDFRMTNAE